MVPTRRRTSSFWVTRSRPTAPRVQREAALAGFAGIDELDDSVSVASHVRERLGWLSPWYRRRLGPTRLSSTPCSPPCSATCPSLPQTVVWHLDEVGALLLRVSLAMAQHPGLLVVDDLDQVHDPARRRIVWGRLEALAAHRRDGRRRPRRAAGTPWTVVPVDRSYR